MNSTTKNVIWFLNRDVADVLSATMKYQIMVEVLACLHRSQMQKNGFTINNLIFFTEAFKNPDKMTFWPS